MSDLKVGDKVVPVAGLDKEQWCNIGRIRSGGTISEWGEVYDIGSFTVNGFSGIEVLIVFNDGEWYVPASILEKAVEKPTAKGDFSFTVPSPDNIDYGVIAADLSKEKPIAFIEYEDVDGETLYAVFLSTYIVHKADCKDIENIYEYSDGVLDYVISEEGILVLVESKNYFNTFIEWVRAVEAARWLNKKTFTVSVTVPKV